jgi:hypothetical protein
MRTRDEHLAWCKQRALEYLPGDPVGAFMSMASDLRKHPETIDHLGLEIGTMLLVGGKLLSANEARDFIEGFN